MYGILFYRDTKGGNTMELQEEVIIMLKKMIDKTESDQIQSSEQLIEALITELTNSNLIGSKKVEIESFAN